ncbi:MAG: TrkA C-terminal domain-containing protein, partial [Prevotella sp.]|nr:TrkA C-terminal domain-containing protein [Prevotella sp.]
NTIINKELHQDDPDIEKREMKLRQIIVNSSSPFIGKTLQESGIRDIYNCMVVGLEEGEENLTAMSPARRFEKGDIIWIVGEEDDLRRISG